MSDKPFPPSAKKLRDARKKGEIPKSAQVVSTAVFAAVLLTMLMMLPMTMRHLREFFDALDVVLAAGVDETMWLQLYERSLKVLMFAVMPVLAAGIVAPLVAGWSQTRGLLSLDPLMPKMERLNPASNIKRLVSLQQMLDLAKKILETVVLMALVAWLMKDAVGAMLPGMHGNANDTAMEGARLLLTMFSAAAVFWVGVSALDYGIQYFTFMRNQRMSFEDIKREYKDMEGDPHVKGQRRQLQQEMAQQAGQQRSMKGAKALVANPTHVGVALAFDTAGGALPRVHAKGLDDQALDMRAEAKRLGIPVFEDVLLARALHRALDVDQEITAEFFQPVADIVVWVRQLADDDIGSEPS